MRPYLWPGVALVAALALTLSWNVSHRARVNAERDAEQARLALKGQIVASDASKKDLQADIAKLLGDNALLKAAYEAARAAAPGAQPKATAHLNTKAFVIGVQPQQEPAPAAPTSEPAPESACVLHDGDSGSVEATIITLETHDLNLLIAGTAEFYRETPGPRVKLGEGPFTAALSDVAALAPQAKPRWGALALGVCTGDGCGLGAAVLLPPWAVLGVQAEGLAGAFLGPHPGALVGLGGRF